jgi:methylthioribose-1-phosphate isomerase
MLHLLGEHCWRGSVATTGDLVAWLCSALVIFGIASYVFFELLKRWRVGLRLSALDESLLHDDGVSVEVITDTPVGSSMVGGVVAEYVDGVRP